MRARGHCVVSTLKKKKKLHGSEKKEHRTTRKRGLSSTCLLAAAQADRRHPSKKKPDKTLPTKKKKPHDADRQTPPSRCRLADKTTTYSRREHGYTKQKKKRYIRPPPLPPSLPIPHSLSFRSHLPSHLHSGTLPTLLDSWAAVLTSAMSSFRPSEARSFLPSSSDENSMILRAVPSPRVSSLPHSWNNGMEEGGGLRASVRRKSVLSYVNSVVGVRCGGGGGTRRPFVGTKAGEGGGDNMT